MTADDKAFQDLDKDKIVNEVAEKVSAKALEDVQKAKQDLIDRLSDNNKPKFSWEQQGRDKPANYDELFGEFEKRNPKLTPDQIDKLVDEKIQKRDEDARKLKEEEEKKAKENEVKTIEEKRKQFDQEWYDLVKNNKLPAPAKAIQEKINAGQTLTPDEIKADEGLQARLRLAQLSQTSNKSAKLAFYEDWDKAPAGATAPVLGGNPPIGKQDPNEYDYDEIAKNRKRMFGY